MIVQDPHGFGPPDYVTIHVADNLPPVAVATAGVTTITQGGMVCFDGSQSYDPEGGLLRYVWEFADGSANHVGASICHVFTGVGSFDVNLSVFDERDAIDMDVVSITVQAPVNHPPVAAPTVTPDTGDAPLTVQFAANASDEDNHPLTYAWNFGDPTSSDNTSALADPSHVYAQPGTYTATLTVSDGQAASPTYSKTISVESAITLSVHTASLTYANKQKTMGFVTLWTDLDTPQPQPDDVLTAALDGVQLFSVPFSSFRKGLLPGAYLYPHNGLLVRLDLTNHQLLVVTPKISVVGINNTNGVDVKVTVGSHAALENITLKAAPLNTLFYQRPVH